MDVDDTGAESGDAVLMSEGIARTLGLSAAESSTSAAELVAAVRKRAQQAEQRAGPEYISPPLLTKPLSAAQMVKLAEICSMFTQDYGLRRQMLLQRLDVTIQSFKWSGKAKGKLDAIEALVAPKRKLLQTSNPIIPEDVMFASQDLLRIHKTSGSAVRYETLHPSTAITMTHHYDSSL